MMRITMDSQATPGQISDDYAVLGLDWVVVLDGATALNPADNGCIHDVPWVVHNLAGHLSRILTISPDVPMADALSDSIALTCAAHEQTCDLANPDSPSSTVTMLRRRGDVLDYLVLGDSPLLLNRGGRIEVIVDDRMAHLDDYSYEAVIAVQNTPDGYYVASTMPEAAYESLYDSTSATTVEAAALLTDGASRLADVFQQLTWEELFCILSKEGPPSVITRTRQAEMGGIEIGDGRKRKLHDDATAVLVEFNQL